MRISWTITILVAVTNALEYGVPCDPTPVYRDNWQYEDSCQNVYLYCDSGSKSCKYKGCTNSDYVKGWDLLLRDLPERCGDDTYCPDNNSKCLRTVNVGAHCEIQRDDECKVEPAICLNSTCFVKNAPIGGNCGTDSSNYISYDASGRAVQQNIIRDNCTEGGYCLQKNNRCVVSKTNDSPCLQDRECLSGTCSNSNICVDGPDVFQRIEPWLWGVVSTCTVIFVLGTLSMLWLLHRYQSKKERAKITKFFGDNEEFARYAHAQDEEPDQVYVDDIGFCPYSRKTNIVYLTTPDYLKSQSLCTNRSVSSRSSSFTNIFNGGSPRNSTPSTAVNSPSALRNNTLNQK